MSPKCEEVHNHSSGHRSDTLYYRDLFSLQPPTPSLTTLLYPDVAFYPDKEQGSSTRPAARARSNEESGSWARRRTGGRKGGSWLVPRTRTAGKDWQQYIGEVALAQPALRACLCLFGRRCTDPASIPRARSLYHARATRNYADTDTRSRAFGRTPRPCCAN